MPLKAHGRPIGQLRLIAMILRMRLRTRCDFERGTTTVPAGNGLRTSPVVTSERHAGAIVLDHG